MWRYLTWSFLVGLVSLVTVACDRGHVPDAALIAPDSGAAPDQDVAVAGSDVGKPLYAVNTAPAAPAPPTARQRLADPIVIPECRLVVIDKEDVPSQREGVLRIIGTEVEPGQKVPDGREVVTLQVGKKLRKFYPLQVGDEVKAGQLLACLDDRMVRDDWEIKGAKLAQAKADVDAAVKTRDEARIRWIRRERLSRDNSATSREEADAAKLMWDRYSAETTSKEAGIKLAERELNQAHTILAMHEIRSDIPGVIKTIYKKRGEFVKSSEPVFQIQDLSRLRVEGLVAVQYLPRLRTGMRVIIEPSQAMSPQRTLVGHLQEVTCVAVSKDSHHPRIVSGSLDSTVRVWDPVGGREQRILRHPAAVHALACTPPGAAHNWCLSGADDGKIRLWDLDSTGKQPLRVFQDQHQQAVRCVAFSPGGQWAVSGGDDQDICLWDTATGALCYRFPEGHHAAVTALYFTPHSQLVSIGRDYTLRLWTLGDKSARLEQTFDRRSGEVTQLGLSPDGRRVLFDQGKRLRLLSLPEGLTDGVIQDPTGATNFTTFALFSPDSRLVLTAGASEGRLQLWRAPTATTRASELRQLIPGELAPSTCAAFAPDGSFLVTGTRERQVMIWPMPSQAEINQQLTAEVTLVERIVDSSACQVRIWAELSNQDHRLLPGTTANMIIGE